jgi:AraC-like DNA-binding protein
MRRPSAELIDPLAARSPGVTHLALALRELVLAEAPEAVEKVYRNHPSATWFGFGSKQKEPKMQDMFCYIALARSHVNLGFCRGASLPDRDHVFEGEGKLMRHVKFRSENDLDRPFVRRYIHAAIEPFRAAAQTLGESGDKAQRPRERPSPGAPPPQRARLTAEQEPFLAVRSLATNYASGYRIESHCHQWHQLLYATSGAMTVSTLRSSWMIPTARAVFIPACATHAIRMWGMVEMRTLYLSPALTRFENKECRVMDVAPLLHELILRTVERMGLDSRVAHDSRLIGLLEDEVETAMAAAEESPLMLPLPQDERVLALAHHVLAQPLGSENVEELAKQYGVARRTLERRYRDETGMSFGMWRQKARLLDSIRLLAEGRSVTDAAMDCGYASVSAFIAAFKGTFGYTPGRL